MIIQGKDLSEGVAPSDAIGGKAAGLVRLMQAGAQVPPWFVLPSGSDPQVALAAWKASGWERVAVRSSALAEDGAVHSFAGMYESILGVSDGESLLNAIARCRASANHPRVRAYQAEHGLDASPVAVIVQELVEGEASGVMFSSDPTNPDQTLISSAWGLGEGIVQGSVPCDTYRVHRRGTVERILGRKDTAISLVEGLPAEVPVPLSMVEEPSLSDAQAKQLAAIGRQLEDQFEGPQDVEWTRCGERLVLLQSRPITQAMPSGQRLLWDNANIIESYHGPTSPLTYSFASRAYTIVYRLFCSVMGVPKSTIDEHSGVFPRMIGLVRGRIFYNLDAWYTVVSLLPGYKWNRGFMESMMGVSEVADPDEEPEPRSWSALGPLLRSVAGLLRRAGRLDKDVETFTQRFEDAMNAHPRDVDGLDAMQLLSMYEDLERRLLWAWSTPIVNDFFVMVFHGLLRSLCAKWIADENDLPNSLLAGEGGLLSAAPAVDGLRLAASIQNRPDWAALFDSERSDAEVFDASCEVPELRAALQDYLDRWGDRCADELKLEVSTIRHEPALLVGTLRAYLRGAELDPSQIGVQERAMRADAESRVFRALSGPKLWVFQWVLSRARRRVRDRENLRFLRTRIFARVRDLFRAIGQHMHASGALQCPEDVFWLTLDEVFGWVRGTTVTVNLAGIAAVRSREYDSFAKEPVPADRFFTWGPVWAHNEFLGTPPPPSGNTLSGLAACPGVVEGRVARVTDPNDPGEIDGAVLIAYRTDPGWVSLFPRIAALVVERGSLLSHSAVVAREMGIPSVVAVAGVMDAFTSGDAVRVDAISGTIERLSEDQ